MKKISVIYKDEIIQLVALKSDFESKEFSEKFFSNIFGDVNLIGIYETNDYYIVAISYFIKVDDLIDNNFELTNQFKYDLSMSKVSIKSNYISNFKELMNKVKYSDHITDDLIECLVTSYSYEVEDADYVFIYKLKSMNYKDSFESNIIPNSLYGITDVILNDYSLNESYLEVSGSDVIVISETFEDLFKYLKLLSLFIENGFIEIE